MHIDLPTSPRHILIIKPSSLGDVVHTLPVLNLLRRRWPEAHMSWLVGSAFASLIQGHPQLNEVIAFDRRHFARAWCHPAAAIGLSRFVVDLARRHFDLVIDLQGLFRSGFLTALTGAAVRVGFANARELAPVFYTHHVPIESMEQHAIDRYLAVTDALGCGRQPVEFKFVLDAADRAHVDAIVGGIGPFAVLLPGATWPTKRWPAGRFAALVDPLRRRFGLSTVVAGASDVAEIAEHIPAAVNAVGRTNLRQLAALIERADLVIANDSGPMHIAAAMGRPLVAIFGPTNPVRTGPYHRPDSVVRANLSCSPCYSRKCNHISCMNWLGIEPVLEAAASQLSRPRPSFASGKLDGCPIAANIGGP